MYSLFICPLTAAYVGYQLFVTPKQENAYTILFEFRNSSTQGVNFFC